MGCGVWGLGFRGWGLGFEVWGVGFGVRGLGCGVWGLGVGVGVKVFGVRTLGGVGEDAWCRVLGLGFRV